MKDKINKLIEALPLIVMIFAMVSGIFYTIAIIWFKVGLPQTDWAIWLIAAVSGLLEYAYIKWVQNQ